jgi:hypothetical protein
MNSKKFQIDWWLVALAAVSALLLWFMLGCATCDPVIIKEPVEVQVPVPVPPEPLKVAPSPSYEECTQEDPRGLLACVGRNVVKLRDYARQLLDEIEAHNAAIGP